MERFVAKSGRRKKRREKILSRKAEMGNFRSKVYCFFIFFFFFLFNRVYTPARFCPISGDEQKLQIDGKVWKVAACSFGRCKEIQRFVEKGSR